MRPFGLFIVSALLLSCTRTPHTGDQLIGSYVANVGNGSDQMELKPDGTFDENLRLPGGKRFVNHGTWKLLGEDSIDLEHAFVLSSNFPPTSAVPMDNWVVPLHWSPI